MREDLARKLLPEARQLAGLASEEWLESYDLKEQRAEICIRDPKSGEIYAIAHLLPSCPYDDRMLMIKSPLLLRAALLMVDRAFDEVRALQKKLNEPRPDLSKECGRLCEEPLFKRFLAEKHGLDISDRERIAVSVRKMLQVKSRSELNVNPQAAERWKTLTARYHEWKDFA